MRSWELRYASAMLLCGLLLLNAGPSVSESADWDQTLSMARTEGEVIVITPPGKIRTTAARVFQERFPKIKLRTEPVHIRSMAQRLAREQRVGKFLYDVCYGCIGVPVYNEWIPSKRVVPLRDFLILPEVRDEKFWTGGWNATFPDSGRKYLFGFVSNIRGSPLYVNRDKISKSEFPSKVSLRELSKSKWKGKIMWNDPSRPGAGSTVPAAMVALGLEELLKEIFVKQDIIIGGSNKQVTEWIVRGKVPIVIGLGLPELDAFRKEGIGTNIEIVQLEEYVQESYGFAAVSVLRNAPHPNAAKVFLNWFLSKDGQTVHTKITADNSRRVDVAPGPHQKKVPAGSRILNMQREENNKFRTRSQALIKQLLR